MEMTNENISRLLEMLDTPSAYTEQEIHDRLMAAIAESGMKTGQALWPLRIAISGLASTPGGAMEIAYLLGKSETLSRVDKAMERLAKGE